MPQSRRLRVERVSPLAAQFRRTASSERRGQPNPTSRTNVIPSEALNALFGRMWKTCQPPAPKTEVMTQHSPPLTSQPTQRKLALLFPKLGILIIEGKKETPPVTPEDRKPQKPRSARRFHCWRIPCRRQTRTTQLLRSLFPVPCS